MAALATPFSCVPLRMERCPDLSALRQAMRDAGYVESAMAQRLLAHKSTEPLDSAVMLRRTADPTPCNTLVRLFALAASVPAAALEGILGADLVRTLGDVGLLRADGDAVLSEAAIMPFEDLMIVQDFYPGFRTPATRPDHVVGVGHSSRVLADLTVRRQGEAVLDVGCGSGFQSLLASRHARRVTATDINRRALNFALFAARLNGAPPVEFREGSLYEPAGDETFDLVLCNPPYVIAPRTMYQYCHGGFSGDGISERVFRGAPAHLRDGGFAVVIFNWHHRSAEDWAERPTGWVKDSGCDAWFLRGDSCDPLAYAATWLNLERLESPSRYEAMLDEWVEYYRQAGMGQMSSGIMILRRRDGASHWLRADDAPPGQAAGSCSAQILRVFATQDYLASLRREEDLLQGRFALADDHRLLHVLRAEGGRWVIQEALLEQARGMPYEGRIDRHVASVLAGCDGSRTLAELVGTLAADVKAPAERIAPGCARIIRKLLETGFLTVVTGQAGSGSRLPESAGTGTAGAAAPF